VVTLEMEPLPRGGGFEFENRITGGVVPKEFIPAIKSGVAEALNEGAYAGYPVVDVKVTAVDGSYHEVDSSELAFRMAAIYGTRACLEQAAPVLLEPVMKVEVTTPPQFVSDIIAGLNARRADIEAVEPDEGFTVIRCYMPLSESFGYATELRSLSQGRASFFMAFDHYAEVPRDLAEKLRYR